jgi:activator of HSP90 ATPase
MGALSQSLKTIHKYFVIHAPQEEVYAALTIPLSIELWTGEPAQMSTEVGSEFSLFNGNIIGKNLYFEKDRELRQQWYIEGSEKSEVILRLHPHKKGTSLELLHTEIPEDRLIEFVDGWKELYMAALQEFFD